MTSARETINQLERWRQHRQSQKEAYMGLLVNADYPSSVVEELRLLIKICQQDIDKADSQIEQVKADAKESKNEKDSGSI